MGVCCCSPCRGAFVCCVGALRPSSRITVGVEEFPPPAFARARFLVGEQCSATPAADSGRPETYCRFARTQAVAARVSALNEQSRVCLESFGNPRKFARTARRVGATMPVLTVDPAEAGVLSASREALFGQAGIISIRDVNELVEVAALLASQPVPAGRTGRPRLQRGEAVQRAAAACADVSLQVAALSAATQERLRRLRRRAQMSPDRWTRQPP